MAPEITCQPVRVAVSNTGEGEDGFLIFADGVLMVTHLQQPIDSELRGQWFLECGFGPCGRAEANGLLWDSPDAAQEWVLSRLASQTSTPGGS